METVDSRHLKWILEHQKKLAIVLNELQEYMPEYIANKHDLILYPKDSVVTIKWKIRYNDTDEDRGVYEYSPADGPFWNEMMNDLEEVHGFWFEEWSTID